MSEKPKYQCILEKVPKKGANQECKPWMCSTCGFEKEEDKRRHAAIRAGKLEKDANGLRRLRVRRNTYAEITENRCAEAQ